ncbi:type I restriction endonuclease [Blastopirellula marina]|uniref:Type I restriction enzyme R protein N-terminal domain-containing protein n=1 Tax=Blastopirellula marina DSM 3645 TaxID=314230 RepID=A3ZSV2_9BACT|nr:type I restriction endonuclease [Blastopirellula marina]EAQ80377.1 hypothetical protein DSM3645_11047 [Blastopirellula marina DSM 3645]
MDLVDKVRELAARAEKMTGQLTTEEATKNALVMPLIHALGYDVFNPLEVVPEFTADVGTKKGEKVDYAIMSDSKPIMLFECKMIGTNLEKITPSQLYRYFSVTDARFGVLTDGIHYQIYSDLDAPNKMDARPFLEFRITDISEKTVRELKKFTKESFDIEDILSTASDLKYTKGIKRILIEEWTNPSEDFVKLFASRVYDGRLTQSTREQFAIITKQAFQEFVSEMINKRLKTALANETGTSYSNELDEGDHEAAKATGDKEIETTEDELEGYHVVKSILREIVKPSRIFIRDTQSYCGVLLDDNNRKPICRLLFNGGTKYLGIFDGSKNMTRHAIQSVNDIYSFADQLKATISFYDKVPVELPSVASE